AGKVNTRAAVAVPVIWILFVAAPPMNMDDQGRAAVPIAAPPAELGTGGNEKVCVAVQVCAKLGRGNVPVASGKVMVRAAVAVPVRLKLLVAAPPTNRLLKGNAALPTVRVPAASGKRFCAKLFPESVSVVTLPTSVSPVLGRFTVTVTLGAGALMVVWFGATPRMIWLDATLITSAAANDGIFA